MTTRSLSQPPKSVDLEYFEAEKNNKGVFIASVLGSSLITMLVTLLIFLVCFIIPKQG
jgi:hypothetical protein